jgi:hypothetical protein
MDRCSKLTIKNLEFGIWNAASAEPGPRKSLTAETVFFATFARFAFGVVFRWY